MADAKNENEVVPGEYVTPPCTGYARSHACKWVPTKRYGVHWLCEVCAKVYLNHLMVRRIKDKLRRARRRVT